MVCQAHQDLKGSLVQKEWPERMVSLVPKGKEVPTVLVDEWERQDQRDPQDPGVHLERRGRLVRMVNRELPDLMDYQEIGEER